MVSERDEGVQEEWAQGHGQGTGQEPYWPEYDQHVTCTIHHPCNDEDVPCLPHVSEEKEEWTG